MALTISNSETRSQIDIRHMWYMVGARNMKHFGDYLALLFVQISKQYLTLSGPQTKVSNDQFYASAIKTTLEFGILYFEILTNTL